MLNKTSKSENVHIVRYWGGLLAGLALLVVVLALVGQQEAAASPAAAEKLFLPVVAKEPYDPPVFLGVYLQGYLGTQSVLDAQVHALDTWASPGPRVSIVGTFLAFEGDGLDYDVYHQLETPWLNGLTCLMNINTSHSSSEIAGGAIDAQVRDFANAYKSWTDLGGGRFAFLAPLPEMNGDWVVWGLDPTGYKNALARIQQIFSEQGVPDSAVRWVFAPNGWNRNGTPGFEDYYPGDSNVDVIGFSSYNFGYHPFNTHPKWLEPITVFNDPYTSGPEGDYLDRMYLMAPNKPIFILQTGTTAYDAGGPNVEKKNQWLRDAYDYLASYRGVRAVIYFNLVNFQNVDWPFYVNGDPAHQYQGYRDGISNPDYEYISPQDFSQLELTP